MTVMQALSSPITAERFKDDIVAKLTLAVGKDPSHASPRDWLIATSLAARDQLVARWMDSTRQIYAGHEKRVYYLSMEFLIGRLLIDVLANLGLRGVCEEALASLGQSLDALKELEPDAALGNGGLGRLAACFLESMGSVGVAGFGYGIRYDHGLFRQVFEDGKQIEAPENWLSFGNPWQFERPEVAYEIGFGGTVAAPHGDKSRRAWWHPAEHVLAVAFDTPIAGWQARRVNTLRLWSARSPELMRLEEFNKGDYYGALAHQARAESISLVLYPDDSTAIGQELRVKQEYFFTSASLHDLLRRHLDQYPDLGSLPDKTAIQLNDTHPALAVPELMRLLVDEHGVAWDEAWRITQGCISYTNHTLLPEALETWPVALMRKLLPRHMQIIEWLHADQMAALEARGVTDAGTIGKVALIDRQEAGDRVRMGNIAFLGAHRVNGVSALHTNLMKETVFSAFHELFPDRIVNQTNGITPRRWLLECNPQLAALVTESIGAGWIGDLEQLDRLAPMAGDAAFRERFAAIKQTNKEALARVIEAQIGLKVDPRAMFDVQIKRIHEYKRQHLNILQTIAHYNAIRAEPGRNWQPRVKIFGGKAAASYRTAKMIINLINDAAEIINNDPVVGERLKVAYLPDYRVSLAEKIIPAADLSEQISTAGMEASGTGNMKFALNGALTIGTLDGANVEIRDRVGADNIFIFGLKADEVLGLRRSGYDPGKFVGQSAALKAALDTIGEGVFAPDERHRYQPLLGDLTTKDYFLVTADFDAYAAAQRQVDVAYGDRQDWFRRAILNTANAGWFSSDRTIRGYARDIWGVPSWGREGASQ
jgi:glycogen phosphorylase